MGLDLTQPYQEGGTDRQPRDRVLHILDPEPDGHVGGADLHVVDLACEQKHHGSFDPAVLLLTAAPLVAERLSHAGVEVVQGHAMGNRYLELPLRLRATISRLSPSLIHSHGYDANYFACWSRFVARKWWAGRPLLFTSHGWVDRPSLFLKTSLDLLTHRFADHIVICSPHQRPRARRAAGHDRITFVCNGVPIDRALVDGHQSIYERFGIPQNSRLVGFVGRLSPEKRVDIFVEVARSVTRRFDDVHFVIAGGGPLDSEVRRQILRSSLVRRITVTGVVPDIDSLYHELQILVVPSITETTSRVTIEAMLWGVPVVASDVGGLPLMIDSGRDGFLCPPGNAAAFSTRVEQLLANPEARIDMARRARAKAREHFNVKTMRRRVEEVYDVLLAR